jgi:hypothetical protein
MALDFPNNPTNGQVFVSGGSAWTWDGEKWTAGVGPGAPFLPLAGGTMLGPIELAADPVAPLQAATKGYVDARYGDNRITNGDMRIDQRNAGAAGTAAGYTIDRWSYAATQTAKGQWQRQLVAIGTLIEQQGFPYTLGFQSTSAYTPLATDYFNLAQAIESDMVSDFAWGRPGAQPVTLSFWANGSVPGTYSGCVNLYGGGRYYPFTYTIAPGAVFTKTVITIPGDTAGAWALSGNSGALMLRFDLGSGATVRGPAGAWSSTQYFGVTGAQSIVATDGATFGITGVKLEIGSVATPFNRQSLAKSLADCQRYYQSFSYTIAGYGGGAGATSYSTELLLVTMRAAPTAVLADFSYANASDLTVTTGPSAISPSATITAAGNFYAGATYQLSAEL